MPAFQRDEARAWARENMRGCANVVIASYTQDLAAINEKGVQHDIEWELEHGFTGALLVSETSITHDEYVSFVQCAHNAAGDGLQLIFHAAFNTVEENIAVGRRASQAGADLALLSYPPSFYPKDSEDIYRYTRTFCDGVDLGVVLFPVPLWGFERIHGASLDPTMVERLVDDCPNVVAVKAEGGFPSIGGFTHLYNTIGDRVIVTMPVEDQAIPLKTIVNIPWMGTSYMEYFGNSVPTMFNLLEAGDFTGAMEIFWRIHPAREAGHQVMASSTGSNLAHRMAWKYMGWLMGMNGGPLRMPTMRIKKQQMGVARRGLEAAGLGPTNAPDDAFFVGRT